MSGLCHRAELGMSHPSTLPTAEASPASSPSLQGGENNKIPAFPPKQGVPGISQRSGTTQHLRGVKDLEAKTPGIGRGRVPGFGSRGWGFSSARETLLFSGRKEDDSDGEKMSGKGGKCEWVWSHPRTFSHLERGKERGDKGQETGEDRGARQGTEGYPRPVEQGERRPGAAKQRSTLSQRKGGWLPGKHMMVLEKQGKKTQPCI